MKHFNRINVIKTMSRTQSMSQNHSHRLNVTQQFFMKTPELRQQNMSVSKHYAPWTTRKINEGRRTRSHRDACILSLAKAYLFWPLYCISPTLREYGRTLGTELLRNVSTASSSPAIGFKMSTILLILINRVMTPSK